MTDATRVRHLWVGLLTLLACVVATHPMRTPDAIFHLDLGRAILAAGTRTIPGIHALEAFTDPLIVAEWLWAVSTYAAYQLGGFLLLSLIVPLLAVPITLAAARMIAYVTPDFDADRREEQAPFMLVTGLAVMLLSTRFNPRPQLLFLLFLPLFVIMCRAYQVWSGRRRLALGAAMVLFVILWAQFHGSFVLALPIFGLFAAAELLRTPRKRELLLAGGLTFALLLASSTSSYGFHFHELILSHGTGDAKLHISEMAPPVWMQLNPFTHATTGAYWLLWIVALMGAPLHRQRLEPWGLTLLGVALSLTAGRFLAVGALLLGPLALEGGIALASKLPSITPRRLLAGIVVLALWWPTYLEFDALYGPIGKLGLLPSQYPLRAAAYLERSPEGTPVLTDYFTGGVLNFFLAGRIRTFVDGRTPLYFDDVDFMLAREAWSGQNELGRTLKRHGIEVAVVSRSQTTCSILEKNWTPVVIDAMQTTFAPRGVGGANLGALAPCGPQYGTREVCDDGGGVLREGIAWLAFLREDPFLDYLRAADLLYCKDDVGGAMRSLPDRRDAYAYLRNWDLLRSEIHLRRGEYDAAASLLFPYIEKGDVKAAEALSKAMRSQRIEPSRSRRVLRAFFATKRDETPASISHTLATVCMQLNDVECARFHGMRAAIRAVPKAVEVLRWIQVHHPSERARRDAAAWEKILLEEPRRAD